MVTRMSGAKTMSPTRTTDSPTICQERNRSLSFILFIGSLTTKLVSVSGLWKYEGLRLFLML